MDHAEDKNARHRLRLAQLFAACIFVLAFVAVQVARYHPPSNSVFVIVGLLGLAINAVNWVMYSRIAQARGWRMAWLKVSRFGATVACVAAIAYGFGESRLSQFALWILATSFVVSILLRVFREETAQLAHAWRIKKDDGGAD